ncbi:hypothetical protein LCGC14_0390330 [marine sediment metagenome]|uniref:Uncharacterized protein n=1 Tax=marine sediment metagenome TaxID=412755 RepID=A0A0F9W8N1_9ZZZZ
MSEKTIWAYDVHKELNVLYGQAKKVGDIALALEILKLIQDNVKKPKLSNLTIDDETIEACCGIPSDEMREHIEKYHGNKFDLKQCPNCESWVSFLYSEHKNFCLVCLMAKFKKEHQ